MGGGASALTDPAAFGPVALTRLTRPEYGQALLDVLGVAPQALSLLPEDVLTPFDNDSRSQATSTVLIAAIGDVAREAVTAALANDARRTALVPCTPSAPTDAACFRTFVERFGRSVLRRPLTTTEVQELAGLQRFSELEGDFFVGVGLVMRVLLQDPEFVYRVEVGMPVSRAVVKLTPYEYAARMSFLLLGAPPAADLLDAAATGKLDTSRSARMVADRLLADPRSPMRVSRFHAMWLGYEQLRVAPQLATAFQAESEALIRKVLFQDKRAWTELLTTDEAFVDDELARIYGLPPPASPTWMRQTDPNRRGIIGQGAFLSAGGKFNDTSPVLRGIQVRERLFCQEIPSPPPEVNADEPPKAVANACKTERYAAHAEAACASCHKLIDPVGSGLEAYDSVGKFRSHELGRPDCPVRGEGELAELGIKFSGPAGLAKELVAGGKLGDCMSKNLFTFITGRHAAATDSSAVAGIRQMFAARGDRLGELLLDVVTSPAFRHRVMEEMP